MNTKMIGCEKNVHSKKKKTFMRINKLATLVINTAYKGKNLRSQICFI